MHIVSAEGWVMGDLATSDKKPFFLFFFQQDLQSFSVEFLTQETSKYLIAKEI